MPRSSAWWLLVFATMSSPAASAQRPMRQWVGGFTVGTEWQFIKLRLPADSTSGTASLDLPHPDACSMRLPLRGLEHAGRRLQFTVETARGPLSFNGSLGPGRSVRGTVSGTRGTGTFRLTPLLPADRVIPKAYLAFVGNYRLESGRTLEITEIDGLPVALDSLRFAKLHQLSAAAFFTDDGDRLTFVTDGKGRVAALELESWEGRRSRGTRVALYREERVRFASGAVTLAGTVLTPLGSGPFPAVVMVHGSNAQAREGYRFLGGDYFARHGIAALIYDKRGVGESGGEWLGAPLDTLASDALAGVRLLAQRGDIDPKRIGIWGISQGGWIAPLAGARSADVSFLISVSGNVIMLWEQETLRQLAELSAAGVPAPVVAEADTTWRLFFRLLQAGRGTEGADAAIERLRAEGVPTPQKSTEIGPDAWFKFMDPFYDPIAVLRRVRQPILWIFGEIDLITQPKPNLERLEPLLRTEPRPDYTIKVFPKANHMIWRGVTGSGAEILCLREIDPGYFTTMAEWIHRVTHR